MRESIRERLQQVCERHEEIERLLADPSVIEENERFRELSQEYAWTSELVTQFNAWRTARDQLESAREMLAAESDSEMRTLATEEIETAGQRIEALETELQRLLVPKDPRDRADVYLEIRAGTGGDEAALFAGDLYRMYLRYAERKGWTVEILSAHEGEHGGYKELIAKLSGRAVFSHLKFESGAHRVQRVPETESQGRIHTSAATVAVLPVPEAVEEVEVDPKDLRIDTFRAAGAGGQHVNKTDSAVRMTHLPTGIVVECQDERSQHKNRAKALAFLQARLTADKEAEQAAEQETERRLQVGSGDRSERIRTYNFPQGRITDHRVNLTLYRIEDVLAGDLDLIIEPLWGEHQADQLASMGGVMTRVDEALAAARARLSRSPTPGLDAELLLADTLGRRRTWLHAWPDATLSPGEAEQFDEQVDRRAVGEPIAYLLGEREFWSLPFTVSPDVLIPRPETEGLVRIALDHLRTAAITEPRILDLGTGSGCVALALAHERPDARVTAVEAADPALGVARANAARHGLVNVEFIEGDWFGPLGSRRFDVIVANPPYIASGDPHLAAGDVRFEPVTALDGGPGGLDGLREIAAGAPHHLEPGGLVAVEHGADQGEAVVSLFTAEGLTTVETHADDAGLPRITAARAPG